MSDISEEKQNEPELPKDSAFSIVTKLVFIPLIIVALAVGIFLLFGWMAYDHKSAEEFLADIKTATPSKKWQAAFVLAGKLRDTKGLGDTDRLFKGMASIFNDKTDYDEKVRSYMAMALGNLGDKRAIPILENAVRTETAGDISMYSMWALGTLKSSESVPLLIEKAKDPEAAVRKTALFVLGTLGRAEAIPVLGTALEDPEMDIRWNAAFALASLGDTSGLPLIRQLLDRRYFENFQEMSFQARSDAMINALLSIARIDDDSFVPQIEKLSREDASLQVRQAAHEVLSILAK